MSKFESRIKKNIKLFETVCLCKLGEYWRWEKDENISRIKNSQKSRQLLRCWERRERVSHESARTAWSVCVVGGRASSIGIVRGVRIEGWCAALAPQLRSIFGRVNNDHVDGTRDHSCELVRDPVQYLHTRYWIKKNKFK